MAPTRAEALRLASGLVLLGLLPKSLGGAPTWRLFGSWAILLQSPAVTRLPNDIDIELSLNGTPAPITMSEWAVPTSVFQLKANRARAIDFSSPPTSPRAFWQTVEVVRGRDVLSAETVNWVCRESPPTEDVESPPAPSGTYLKLAECHIFAVTAKAYPGLALLPTAQVWVASREECIAQKWTRISTPRSDGRRHTRWQDLADVYDLVLGVHASMDQVLLLNWLKKRADELSLRWPCLLPQPPLEWHDFWDSYNFRSGIARPSPQACARELNAYLKARVVESR